MKTLQEIKNDLARIDSDIRFYTAKNNLLVGDAHLGKLQSYKNELEQEFYALTHPIREKTEAESLELSRILNKTEISRTPTEQYFIKTHMNLK